MSIYADNAATTRMSAAAVAAMLPCLDTLYGNPSSIHTPGQKAHEVLCTARERIAACLGCSARELIFTSGGSEADTQAIRSAAALGAAQGKKHILTTAFEHHAVLHTVDALEREGFCVTRLPIPENGRISPEQVQHALRPDTCLVSVMYANNETGTIQPIADIGAVCRRAGVLFHTDAVQAAGHLPIRVHEQQIDLLSLSAHKFHGPKGIGVLYARRGLRLERLLEGGAQERNQRPGTENVPAIAGMAAALEEACASMDRLYPVLSARRDALTAGLCAIPHTIFNGDRVHRLPGHVSVCFEGVDGDALLLLLDQKGIYASSGSACTSGSLEPSHVLLALGRSQAQARGAVRFSLSDDVTDEEIQYIIATTAEAVARLRAQTPVSLL